MDHSFNAFDNQMASITGAYLAMLEAKKHHHRDEDKPTEEEVETVAKELEKAADELEESFIAIFESAMDGKIRVSPEKVADLLKKATAYKDSLTHDDMMRFADAMQKKFTKADDEHKDIHDENGTLKEALLEALTGDSYDAHIKVASSSQDPDLLAAMAQQHMGSGLQDPGANSVCLKIALNKATPMSVLRKLEDHEDPKVGDAAKYTKVAKQSMTEEVLTEGWGGGPTLQDDYVAKKFAAGEPAERKAAKSDGKSYTLYGNEIARRSGDGKVHFSWEGWYTPTTERHLNAIIKHVAPGKSISKAQHKADGTERFTADDLK